MYTSFQNIECSMLFDIVESSCNDLIYLFLCILHFHVVLYIVTEYWFKNYKDYKMDQLQQVDQIIYKFNPHLLSPNYSKKISRLMTPLREDYRSIEDSSRVNVNGWEGKFDGKGKFSTRKLNLRTFDASFPISVLVFDRRDTR